MTQSVFGPVNAAGISGTDYVNTRNNQITAIVSMHSGPNPPSSPPLGMVWLDTNNQTRPVVKVYDGSQWVQWSVLDTANHRMRLILDADRDSYVWSPADGVLEFVIESVAAVRIVGAGIGLSGTSPTLALDLSGKTTALAVPVGTDTQAPSANPGYVRYSSTQSRLTVADGTNHKNIAYTDDTLPVDNNTIDAAKLKGPNGAALGNGNFGDNVTMGGDGTFRVGPMAPNVSRGTLRNATNTDAWEWNVPSGVRRIDIALDKVESNGNTIVRAQLGTSDAWSETGYDTRYQQIGGSSQLDNDGFRFKQGIDGYYGIITFLNLIGNIWVANVMTFRDVDGPFLSSGRKDLGAELTRVRLKTDRSTNAFIGGQANILYS